MKVRHPYPKNRAPRVDRSKMTDEEWVAHKKRKQNERCARFNNRNPGLSNGRLRERRARFPWYAPLLAAGDRARNSGLDYNLTKEWAIARWTGRCELTGVEFVISYEQPASKSGIRPFSPSIDRIDPTKGYTQDNCRFILAAVNSFKGTMTDAEMFMIARTLVA